jgi:hypothetical protein
MSVGIVYHAVQRYLCRHDPQLGRQELVILVENVMTAS